MEYLLNSGQQAASNGVFKWLFSPQQELCISGPGGVGKTTLMGQLIDEVIPRYHNMCSMMDMDPLYQEVHMTATTNKAAEVLGTSTNRPTRTAHNLFKLTVYNDYNTGQSIIKKKRDWQPLTKSIIFVDEASMIDTALRNIMLDSMRQCKIIYVGDHCQLPPVGEEVSPIYADNLPFFELTQPMRNADKPDLVALCQQLRETVKTGKFYPIRVVPGVIDHLDKHQMGSEVRRLFLDPSTQDRIMCYRNEKVRALNSYIRDMRGMPPDLTVGEYVVNNSTVTNKTMTLLTEEEFRVEEVSELVEFKLTFGGNLHVRYCTLVGKRGPVVDVPVPAYPDVFFEMVKLCQKKGKAGKGWSAYYELVENFPDLRPRDVCTVYKAQGSTFQTALVDLGDISSCQDANIVARMLYVACSRAKTRVITFGKLDPKYGGLIW